MSKAFSLDNLESLNAVQVPEIMEFTINLAIAALLCWVVSWFYSQFSSSLHNKKSFSSIFGLIGMTTMVIISIIKSSLALSLGLVGALSIIRFRTAIKDPEELGYLFLTIAIGLGLGAGQRLITVVGIGLILAGLLVRSFFNRPSSEENLYLTISSEKNEEQTSNEQFADVLVVLKKNCRNLKLKRFEKSDVGFESSFVAEFKNFEQFKICNSEIEKKHPSLNVSYIDSDGF